MGSKHCNINERSVWITRKTVLKNKPHLVTFHENDLVSLWTFLLILVCSCWWPLSRVTWKLLFNSYYTLGKGATPFPGLLHFTLDPYLIMLSVKQSGIFWVFGMSRPGIEPWSPWPLANSLLIRQMAWFLFVIHLNINEPRNIVGSYVFLLRIS